MVVERWTRIFESKYASPEIYAQQVNQCMDNDSKRRPNAAGIFQILSAVVESTSYLVRFLWAHCMHAPSANLVSQKFMTNRPRNLLIFVYLIQYTTSISLDFVPTILLTYFARMNLFYVWIIFTINMKPFYTCGKTFYTMQSKSYARFTEHCASFLGAHFLRLR
jgi:hypothetical protein